MEIKQLEEEFTYSMSCDLWANNGDGSADIYGKDDLATDCVNITVNHMKGFSEWISKKEYRELPVYEETQGNNYCYTRWSTGNSYILLTDDKSSFHTTEELIELYFESLNK